MIPGDIPFIGGGGNPASGVHYAVAERMRVGNTELRDVAFVVVHSYYEAIKSVLCGFAPEEPQAGYRARIKIRLSPLILVKQTDRLLFCVEGVRVESNLTVTQKGMYPGTPDHYQRARHGNPLIRFLNRRS